MERGNFEHFRFSESREVSPSFYEIFLVRRGDLENNTHIDSRSLERFSYAPKYGFEKVEAERPRSGTELLYSSEARTLIVPPPTSRSLQVEDLAQMALPVVGYIDQIQPDIIIGCDRGGRMYTNAVERMNAALNAGKVHQLPTLDEKIHFAKLSTSIHKRYIVEALRGIMHTSMEQAQRTGKSPNGNKLRILFIDDWIASGRTRDHILEALQEVGVDSQAYFAVMCGGNADVSGGRLGSVPWQDDPTILGVDYDEYGKGYAVRTLEARRVRDRLQQAVRHLAKKLL